MAGHGDTGAGDRVVERRGAGNWVDAKKRSKRCKRTQTIEVQLERTNAGMEVALEY